LHSSISNSHFHIYFYLPSPSRFLTSFLSLPPSPNNSPPNHPLSIHNQGTRHAEFLALSKILSTHPPSILPSTDLYVTVEPCIMCASLLRQFKIRTVYFGAANERFGGTGGVLSIHEDKGVESGYKAYGGIYREEAILLLRRFYVQDNGKVPEEKVWVFFFSSSFFVYLMVFCLIAGFELMCFVGEEEGEGVEGG
jgi:tRNA(Arg) A34 adenosine deaminase TadA